MEMNKRGYNKPNPDIVSFEKIDVVLADTEQIVAVMDTSKHSNFSILIVNKNSYGTRYKVEVANIDKDSKTTSWASLQGDMQIEGNQSAIFNSACLTDRVRLIAVNDVVGQQAQIDLYLRLNPFITA